MGGDNAPDMVIDGVEAAARQNPKLRFLLYGDETRLNDILQSRPAAMAASEEDLLRCHPASHLSSLIELDEAGGGRVDADTAMSAGSWTAARLAAGAGLVAVGAADPHRAEHADVDRRRRVAAPWCHAPL